VPKAPLHSTGEGVGLRDAGHEGWTPETFLLKVNEQVQQLAEAQGIDKATTAQMKLTLNEVIAVRLYTGKSILEAHAMIESSLEAHALIESSLEAHALIESSLEAHAMIESSLEAHAMIESSLEAHALIESSLEAHALIESSLEAHAMIESSLEAHALIQVYTHTD
jgi:hypothetical protein